MNTKILAAVIAATLITSCSSLYKATSTPDDIYYSPSPATSKATATDAGYDQYETAQSSNDDQYLRMKVQNPTLWGNIDDYSYWNDSRYDYGYSCNSSRLVLLTGLYNSYGYNGYFGSPYMGLGYGGYGYGWNNWNSPYQTVVLYKSPTVYTNTNKANLTAYHNIQYNNTNRNKYNNSNGSNGYQNGNYTTRGSSYNNSSNSNYVAPARSFSTSSSSNSAGGRSGGFSSTGSSAGGSRATRH